MKRFPVITLICSFLLSACGIGQVFKPTITPTPSFPYILSPTFTSTSTSIQTFSTKEIVSTPIPVNTPWIFSSGLSIEEHPLAKIPEIEPLVIYPLESLTQLDVLNEHSIEWGKTLPPNEYYNVGWGDLWVMQGKDKLEAVWGSITNGKSNAQVARNGNVIFSTSIDPPGTTSPLKVLTVYDTHWVFEIAQQKESPPPNTQLVNSFFSGEIFIDGQSLDNLYGYDQSFGFQTINGRPFYFYTRDGKTGVSFDGEEIPLGYDGVSHYGCCSGGELNPRMAQNIVGFYAWRESRWFYTEIGLFHQP